MQKSSLFFIWYILKNTQVKKLANWRHFRVKFWITIAYELHEYESNVLISDDCIYSSRNALPIYLDVD